MHMVSMRLNLCPPKFLADSHETSSTGAPEGTAAGPAAPRAGESDLEKLHGTSYIF